LSGSRRIRHKRKGRRTLFRDLAGSASESITQGESEDVGSSQCLFGGGVSTDVEPAFCAGTGQQRGGTSQPGEIRAEQHSELGGNATGGQRSHRAMARCEMADPARED